MTGAAGRAAYIFQINWMLELGDTSGSCKDRVTGLTVLGYHPAIGADVLPVVTAEASRVIKVADVIGMRAPVNPHKRKDVGFVDVLHGGNGSPDLLRLSGINLGLAILVKGIEGGGDSLGRVFRRV